MNEQIKLGVRLYCFHNLYPYEKCLELIRGMGCTAFDVTASQTVAGYPWPSDDFIRRFVDTYRSMGMELVSYDGNLDIGIRNDRLLNEDELFHYALNDLYFAARFGAKIHRIQLHMNARLLERLIPYCELLGVKAGIEIHSPSRLDSPGTLELLEMMERTGSPWVGLIPDMSIFTRQIPASAVASARAQGARPEEICLVDRCLKEGAPMDECQSRLQAARASQAGLHYMTTAYGFGIAPLDLELLRRALPHIIHVHGKFWDLDAGGGDPCTPVEQVLPVLRDGGYTGYITSEYEGIRYGNLTPPEEMVARQLALYRRILAGD